MGALLDRKDFTRRERITVLAQIVAAAVVLCGVGALLAEPLPKNCLSACSTSRTVLASDEGFTTP